MRGLPADGTWRKLPLSPRQGTPVSDNSRRWNGAQWKSQPVERFTGGSARERSGSDSNWRSQARNAADVSLKAAFGDSSAVVVLSYIDFSSWFFNHLPWNSTANRGRTAGQNGPCLRVWLRCSWVSPVGIAVGGLSTLRQHLRLL